MVESGPGDVACTTGESPRDRAPVPDPGRDSDAQMTLILELHLPALRRFANRLCGAPDLAADVVQQTCLKAWSARAAFGTDRPALPWLFQILKNEYLQNLRASRLITNVDAAMFDQQYADSARQDIRFDILSLQKQLSRLPEDQRQAIMLVIGVGLSYDEAGTVCDCFAGTIKSRVSRGKTRLREILGIGPAEAPAAATS